MESEREEAQQGRVWVRLVALAVLIAALYGVAHLTGLTELQSIAALQLKIDEAGPWGWLVFAGIFILLNQMHVPGMFFLLAAMWLFGPWEGAVVGGCTAQISLMIHYAVVRAVGGAPLSETQRPWLQRWVKRVQEHPIRAMIVIRIVMVMSPTVNIPVIMSGITFRDYTIGTALGLALFLGVVALGYDVLEPWIKIVLNVS